MNEDDESELRRYRDYEQFKEHMTQFLVDHGANKQDVRALARALVWTASVVARMDGWLRWAIGAAFLAAVAGVVANMALPDLIAGLGS